ncbi:aminoacyl-histidine dipeptidase [Spongorhabdus nitratireducens]
MSALEQLSPSLLWKHFAAICEIPHPSRHEEAIRQYVVDFAEQRGLEYEIDETGNIVVRKPATPGMEDRPGVVLQGHLDMVPQADENVEHDFLKDPIRPQIKGEWLTATGTTLGADNGIGMAAGLAVLEADDLVHGPVEVLLTVNEEAGMVGAQGLQGGWLKGDILMNLDTEAEGELYVGCAGGIFIRGEASFETEAVPAGYITRTVKLSGLKGGHSGCDIHLYRGNAIRLLTRTLKSLEGFNLRVASLRGGSVANAIPRLATAVVAFPEAQLEAVEAHIDQYFTVLSNEYSVADEGLKLELLEGETAEVMAMAEQRRWLDTLHAFPNGVLRMSDSVEGVVETSVNLGVAKIMDKSVTIETTPRSLIDSACEDVRRTVHGLLNLAGAEVSERDGYPGWKPSVESPIRDVMQGVHKELFGKEADIKVIHAGLECGLLGSKYPQWDMISCGPTIQFPHSPSEQVHIESVSRFWDLVKGTLAAIPAK